VSRFRQDFDTGGCSVPDSLNPGSAIANRASAKYDFPNLKRHARGRRHARSPIDSGMNGPVRDTLRFSQSLAGRALTSLDIDQQNAFVQDRNHDEQNPLASHAIRRDRKPPIRNVHQTAEEHTELFEADQPH
jgi:hypothetical protein